MRIPWSVERFILIGCVDKEEGLPLAKENDLLLCCAYVRTMAYSIPLRRLRARLVYLLRKSPRSSRATPEAKVIIINARDCVLLPVIGIPVGTPVGCGKGVGEGAPVIGRTSTTGVGVSVGTAGSTVGCAGTSVFVGRITCTTGVGVLVGVFVGVLVGVLVGVFVGLFVGVLVGVFAGGLGT